MTGAKVATSRQPLLEVDSIELSFSGVRALQGVSLTVEEGELVAVIGPNGAGKTSLFNCICGVYQPDSGSVRLDGHDIRGLAPHAVAARGVARMFQNLAVFGQLSVLDNLLLGRHHRMKAPWWKDMLWSRQTRREAVAHREATERVIDLLDLESVRHIPAAILPYGVLKRVELGRALCMEPRLLLLDEPAAGLNQEETEDMARYLLDVKEELGITQILIEHALPFVLELADRIAVLDFGQRIALGTPDVVRTDAAVIAAYTGQAMP